MIQQFPNYKEWIATVAFYKSVHVVEAVLANKNEHSNSHADRTEKIKHDHTLQVCFGEFKKLQTASCVARYLTDSAGSFQTFSDYMPQDDVLVKCVYKWLFAVEQKLASQHASVLKTLKKIQPPPKPPVNLPSDS